MEPPRRPDLQRRIVPGERSQFARVGRLVEREQDARELRRITDAGEQRPQRVHVVRAHRNVGALVAAEALEHRRIVIAEAAWVDLHDEAVVDAHPCHFRQHLSAERFRFVRGDRARQRAIEQPLAGRGVEVQRARRRVAVIGRCRAHRLEICPPNAMRREVAAPRRGVLAGQGAELRDVRGESLELRIDDRIGPIRRHHAPAPAARADRLVVHERIERRLRGRDHLDVEALEQCARTVRGISEARGDAVEVTVGAFRRKTLVDAEHRMERMVEP